MATPEDLEFLAEQEMIGIVPNINLDETLLIEKSLNPLKAGLPTQVPLWVAMHLRKLERCTVIPPDWMTVQFLEHIKVTERESVQFTKMPSPFYMEICKILFLNCAQDIPGATEIKTLIKDIWDNRVSKLRTFMLTFIETGASYAKVDNLTSLEMSTVRPFFPNSLEQLHRVKKGAQQAIVSAEAQASSSSMSMSMDTSNSEPQPGPSRPAQASSSSTSSSMSMSMGPSDSEPQPGPSQQ